MVLLNYFSGSEKSLTNCTENPVFHRVDETGKFVGRFTKEVVGKIGNGIYPLKVPKIIQNFVFFCSERFSVLDDILHSQKE